MLFQNKDPLTMSSNKSEMSDNDDLIIKPKLIKKGSLGTLKQSEDKVAPSNISVGHDINIDNQVSNNIEEKVAHLSLQMNQVIVRPYLQQALDYLKTSKHDSINSYNQLSDQIANEIRIISQNTQAISVSLKEAQDVVAKTQEIIRNKYNNAIEDEISSGALNLDYEYNIVAEHYELSLQLTQELSRYKARIDSLLSTQKILDDSIVPSVSRLQLEIDNLELLIHSFDSSDYADILAKKTGTSISRKTTPSSEFTTRSEELNKLVNNSSIESLENMDRNVRLNEINRLESPNSQRINTKNYDSSFDDEFTNARREFNSGSSNPRGPRGGNDSNGSRMYDSEEERIRTERRHKRRGSRDSYDDGYFDEDSHYRDRRESRHERVDRMSQNRNSSRQNYQFDDYGVDYNGPAPMSRQEQKMMRKLREQQMKFEHMMRMNEMIFEYNKSIDKMMFKQYEYEQMHKQQLENAKHVFNTPYTSSTKVTDDDSVSVEGSSRHIYEAKIPVETVAENISKSKNDKIFVVRQAEPVSEKQAKELKNRGSVKSIRVIK